MYDHKFPMKIRIAIIHLPTDNKFLSNAELINNEQEYEAIADMCNTAINPNCNMFHIRCMFDIIFFPRNILQNSIVRIEKMDY